MKIKVTQYIEVDKKPDFTGRENLRNSYAGTFREVKVDFDEFLKNVYPIDHREILREYTIQKIREQKKTKNEQKRIASRETSSISKKVL